MLPPGNTSRKAPNVGNGSIAQPRDDRRPRELDEPQCRAEEPADEHVSSHSRILMWPASSRDQPSRPSGQNRRTYGSSATYITQRTAENIAH